MQGAQQWTLYISTNATKNRGPSAPPELDPTSFFQFDIIVKDSQSAPQTGWVFSTLVYDKDAPGANFWDKMVPLGAMWGNDPQATSPGQPLMQNWINPAAHRDVLPALQELQLPHRSCSRMAGPGATQFSKPGSVSPVRSSDALMPARSKKERNAARHVRLHLRVQDLELLSVQRP
jgi:hypothetical protein